MKKYLKKINKLKQKLISEYSIESDRDLIKQLGIREEDKDKLFTWIRYQGAYDYRNGFEDGQEEFREKINLFINK